MPQKRLSPLQAIRTTCLLCQGGGRKLVAECCEITCPLHPYRMGSIPENTAPALPKIIRKFCLRCAGCAADANACKGGTPVGSMDPCALYPYRRGRMPAKKQARKKMNKKSILKKTGCGEVELALPF